MHSAAPSSTATASSDPPHPDSAGLRAASPLLAGGQIPDFTQPGPCHPLRLPRLEHTCARCFPGCIGDQRLLRIDVNYPKGGSLGERLTSSLVACRQHEHVKAMA